MAISEINDTRIPVKFWTKLDEVEAEAIRQLKNVAALPWTAHHVAVMPDVHAGKGATVGSVVAMRGAVSPSSVGVDIGCGMAAVKTNLKGADLPDSLHELRLAIEAVIPVGFASHKHHAYLTSSFAVHTDLLFMRFSSLAPEVQQFRERAVHQLGTLGGGNHFIELELDAEDKVWLMLHSGSRHIGLRLAELHIERAKKLAHNKDLSDPELSVLLAGTPEMDAYLRDLYWAQEYAALNRALMLESYQAVMQKIFPHAEFGREIHCHHNYVAEETHFGERLYVTRKGAIRARTNDYGIIPGSMGAKSFIVKGLGNPESFTSASHGAGRRMSRTKAKKTFTTSDLDRQLAGIECRKDKGVLDEAPGAYKDIDRVMSYQTDLVEVVAELHQVLCIKG